MPELSLTSFVDIVSASGTSKLAKVRNIKYRSPYTPASDFYRLFREFLIDIHHHARQKSDLDDILGTVSDKKKLANYPSLIEGYKKWWGRKNIKWFQPLNSSWSAHGVDIRVNPELGLNINGVNYLIKLYMKTESISKSRVNIITHLMEESLSTFSTNKCLMTVLDVRNGHLFIPTVPIKGLSAALDGELAYISAVWSII